MPNPLRRWIPGSKSSPKKEVQPPPPPGSDAESQQGQRRSHGSSSDVEYPYGHQLSPKPSSDAIDRYGLTLLRGLPDEAGFSIEHY
ncbi:hypothetical protein P168DRAFT_39503 [Aspergillus campestris IBT 28561]|uniref:Uncharacterized protein n=1 Tax=Aspergillus campestris (strain IBT 28561) TaxID=1392248 RepID=A0A2I1CWJ6_ASPC2|nr:uncharacterized protein P168DRAFT_39503 [Aspergillus campestris IBT 28561]PKY01985.1 hypothetical protein P168DRAFT_39503 [Aspergillus campestris IBT 28561]